MEIGCKIIGYYDLPLYHIVRTYKLYTYLYYNVHYYALYWSLQDILL